MTGVSEDERLARINAWIDAWMEKLNARAKDYQAQGLSPEDALDRATHEIQIEIRRSPWVDLD